MGPLLTCYIIIIGSVLFGAIICSFSFGLKAVAKISIVWMAITTFAVFTNLWVLLAFAAFAAVAIRNEPPEVKLYYFIAFLPVLPLEAYNIPFPGVNYLWELSFIRFLSLSLLFPLFLVYILKDSPGGKVFNVSDLFFLLFIILTAIMTLRLPTLVGAIRTTFSLFVEVVLPYFVISRFLLKPQSLNWIFSAFLVTAAFLSFFSIFESILQWRFYTELLISLNLDYDPIAMVPYARSGVIRTSGGPMLQTLAFAYFISLAIIVCFFFWQKGVMRFIPAAMLLSLYVVALLFTGSRGGILAVVTGIFVLYFVRSHKSVKLLLTMAGAVIIPVLIGYFAAFGFSAIDNEGTFEYRYQLVLNSLNAVSQNPLLGSDGFLNNASLAQSRQGEGIIDVVNMYLLVLLEYGVVGLFLYVMIFVSIIRDVVRKKSVHGFDHKELLLALLFMTLIFIGTCSYVSFIPWYVIVFLAIARAYSSFREHVSEEYKVFMEKVFYSKIST